MAVAAGSGQNVLDSAGGLGSVAEWAGTVAHCSYAGTVAPDGSRCCQTSLGSPRADLLELSRTLGL